MSSTTLQMSSTYHYKKMTIVVEYSLNQAQGTQKNKFSTRGLNKIRNRISMSKTLKKKNIKIFKNLKDFFEI